MALEFKKELLWEWCPPHVLAYSLTVLNANGQLICHIGPDLKTNYIQLILELQKAQHSLAWAPFCTPPDLNQTWADLSRKSSPNVCFGLSSVKKRGEGSPVLLHACPSFCGSGWTCILSHLFGNTCKSHCDTLSCPNKRGKIQLCNMGVSRMGKAEKP